LKLLYIPHSNKNPEISLFCNFKYHLLLKKIELESRMQALQESRKELMVQLEGLMKLLKVTAKYFIDGVVIMSHDTFFVFPQMSNSDY
jgi:hypothetical protein